MPEPQAIATHEGLNILSLDFTFSRGSRPSIGHAEVIPDDSFSGKPGTLTLTYGDFEREFTGCALDFSDLRIERGQRINVRIRDRRWQWQNAIVTYRANLPESDGTVRIDTKRTPKQIADMLFGILGEMGSNTSDMPSNIFPFVEWDGIKVVDALDELCFLTGCIIAPSNDDKFHIRRLGVGSDLPENAVSLTDLYPTPSADLPRGIQCRTGEAVVQSKFLLRAVTREFSGDLVTYRRASYTPANGWEYETPYGFYNVGGEFIDRDFNTQFGSTLAMQNVWRVFEVWEQAPGGLSVPGMTDEITSMEQIVLRDTLNDFGYDMNDVKRAMPAYVEGIFWTGCDNYANTPIGTRYPGKFTIDAENGLVVFDEPVVALSSTNTHSEPVLYLTTSYTVRPKLLSTPNRYQFTRNINSDGKGVYGVDRRDLTPRITQRYANISSPQGIYTNQGQIQNAIDAQLNALEKSLKPQPAQDGYYGGWIDKELDGTIAQISWTMGRPGRPTGTRITRWNEHWPSPGVNHVA